MILLVADPHIMAWITYGHLGEGLSGGDGIRVPLLALHLLVHACVPDKYTPSTANTSLASGPARRRQPTVASQVAISPGV